MNRRWLVNKTNADFLEYLSRKTSVSTALTQILVNRGLKDAESIKDFLSPSLENLHDPFLMPDMKKAVRRIETAVGNGEIALVFGDYDADGITATALLVSVLRMLGLKTYYHIPNRIIDGYGLNMEGIRKAQSLGAGLIITVDCGISSEEEVSMAVSLGIDVIITDHHEPPEKLPDAMAIINPHSIDSQYPYKHLAGVGVAYKLAQAILGHAENGMLGSLLALTAIGTIADSVPLTGENRILATYGLKALNNVEYPFNPVSKGRSDSPSKPWIDSLKEVSGIANKDLHSGLLSYTIIPRINAAGRLSDANEVVELFLTQDSAKARGIASFLDDKNRKRQKIEEDVYKSALGMIDAGNLGSSIVLYSSEWHPGVIGIVASRLADIFYRPTFLFSVTDNIAKGSARSIPPFHLYRGITECAELLLGFGGHSQAAGLKLHAENLPAFKEQINIIVKNTLCGDDMMPTIEIDAGVELFEVNFNLVKEIDLLEPFGSANQRPVFGAKGIEVREQRIVGNNHLKMKLKQKAVTIDTIGFCMADSLDIIENSRTVDIAFAPGINEWNGNRSLQLNLKALRPGI